MGNVYNFDLLEEWNIKYAALAEGTVDDQWIIIQNLENINVDIYGILKSTNKMFLVGKGRRIY